MGKPLILQYPMMGKNTNFAATTQPAFTSPRMNNARPRDVLAYRARGGQMPAWAKAYNQHIGNTLRDSNSDIVEAGGYEDMSTGSANWGLTSGTSRFFLSYNHKMRVRQNGSITKIKMYFHTKPGDVTAFYFQIWRKDGSTYDRVAQEDIWSKVTGGQTNLITLDTPITVQEGDFIGYGFTCSTGPGYFLKAVSSVNPSSYLVTDSVPGATNYDWEAQGTNPSFLPLKIYMQAPVVVTIGDSIMAGHPAHSAFIETDDTTDIDSTIGYNLADLMDTVTYQNMGDGSDTTTQINTRFADDVVALAPRIAVIEGGVNDISGGSISLETFIANWTAMLSACEAADILPIALLILPWTNGTTQQMQKRDTWNAALAALCAASYPTAGVVDAGPYVGQFRVGGDADNFWDIKTAYVADGVHFNAAGHAKIAELLLAGIGLVARDFNVPVVALCQVTIVDL